MKLEVKNVSKKYPNGYKALKNVDLSIKQGEFVAFIGLSGAGKTTLLKTINGLNKITGGDIHVGDFHVNKLSTKEERDLRKAVGIVFQGYNLISQTTVFKNTLNSIVPDMPVWRRFFGIPNQAEKNLALKSLADVGILDWTHTRADQLSGGQMQRVALARTITQRPRVILADEPVAALDPLMLKKVMDDFKRVNLTGVTVIANLHHVEVALKYATRIIGIKEGKIVYDGSSEKVTVKILKEIYGNKLKGFNQEQLDLAINEKKELLIEMKNSEKNQSEEFYNESKFDVKIRLLKEKHERLVQKKVNVGFDEKEKLFRAEKSKNKATKVKIIKKKFAAKYVLLDSKITEMAEDNKTKISELYGSFLKLNIQKQGVYIEKVSDKLSKLAELFEKAQESGSVSKARFLRRRTRLYNSELIYADRQLRRLKKLAKDGFDETVL